MTSARASVVILVPRPEVNSAAVSAPGRRPLGEPRGQGLAELGMHGHGPGLLALADEMNLALAGAQPDIGDVQGADLGDAGPGEQRQQRDRPVPGGWAGLDGAQVAQLGPRLQGLRRVPRPLGGA